MTSLTLSVPEDLREEMKQHPEINWSEVARQAIHKRLADLKFMQEFTKDSEMTMEDAVKLGKQLKADVWKRHQESL